MKQQMFMDSCKKRKKLASRCLTAIPLKVFVDTHSRFGKWDISCKLCGGNESWCDFLLALFNEI